MSDWKQLLTLPKEELANVPYNDPRLDAFATEVERRYNLPAGLIEATKNAGERSQTRQVSGKGAKGVMQFIDATRSSYEHDVSNPMASIDAAGRYMKDLVKQYKGNSMAALAAYNGGGKAGKSFLKDKTVPAKETKEYLERVRDYMKAKHGTK